MAATRQRVVKLIDAGVMQIVAVTDPMQLGFTRQAMIEISTVGDIGPITEQLAKIDEVVYLVTTVGRCDLLAEVVVTDDDHLQELVNQRIRTIEGVIRYRVAAVPATGQADL